MAKRVVNIALIGQKFMGRAHSNAYLKVSKFFDLPVEPVMHTIVGRDEKQLKEFAGRWGWQNYSTNWRKVVTDPQIDLVDIGTPNNLHEPMAVAALKAGKAVACEKPLAATFDQAKLMAAQAARAKVHTFVWFNYRRCPAIGLAHQLVRAGKLGRIYHVRAAYLQDWAASDVPMSWQFDKKQAGAGVHGDLNAHIVDMARFITGQEIVEVCGMDKTFIKQRRSAKTAKGLKKVTVPDAFCFMAKYNSGAIGTFEATRFATGRKNSNQIEINGQKGSLCFNFQQMNELLFFDASLPIIQQGWTNILATDPENHPYVDAWWPPGHPIGYEHAFVNMAADILKVLGNRKPVLPLPDFADALKTQQVLEASLISAKKKKWIKLSQVK